MLTKHGPCRATVGFPEKSRHPQQLDAGRSSDEHATMLVACVAPSPRLKSWTGTKSFRRRLWASVLGHDSNFHEQRSPESRPLPTAPAMDIQKFGWAVYSSSHLPALRSFRGWRVFLTSKIRGVDLHQRCFFSFCPHRTTLEVEIFKSFTTQPSPLLLLLLQSHSTAVLGS